MTGATLAPNAAIQLGASGDFVYLLNDNSTVSKRDIAIGPADGKHTVITSGLAAGDKVVIDGVDRLRDGAKVKVVDRPAASGRAGRAGVGPGRAARVPRRGRRTAAGSITSSATTSRARVRIPPRPPLRPIRRLRRRVRSRRSAGRVVFGRAGACQPDHPERRAIRARRRARQRRVALRPPRRRRAPQ